MPRPYIFNYWCDLWRVLSRQWRDRAVALHGAFDVPYPGQRFMHTLQVSGWLLAPADEPVPLELYLGATEIARGESTRGDGVSHGGIGSTRRFSFFVEPARLQGVRGRLLRLVATSPTGQRSTIAVTPVRRVSRVPSAAARSEYGKVWNAVSRHVTEARISVAGYADESEWDRSGRSTADYVSRALGITRDDRVLEIGCGTGRIGRHMAPLCGTWVGSDVSSNMLDLARQDLGAIGNVEWMQLNGYDLHGIPSASLDAVYCSAVFMHLDEWDRFRYVKDALRVLRPGGRAFFDNYSLLGEAGWRFFEETSQLDVAVRPPNVSRASTPQELRCYLEHAGYVDIRVEEGDLFATAIGYKP